MSDVKIAFLSAHFSGAIKLDYLLSRGLRIDAVVNPSGADAERLAVAGYVDLGPRAEQGGIPVYRPASFGLTDAADQDFFRRHRFDILLISGWQRLVPQAVLSTLGVGAVGEHGSSEYLPRGRGRSPIIWSLIANRRRFVLHLFLANTEADAGEIIAYETFEMSDFDTVYTVFAKVALASGRLFLENLDRLARNEWAPIRAAPVDPSHLRKRGADDDFLDWEQSTRDLYNKVRAITFPYPGAKARLGQEVMSIWKAQPFDFAMDDFSARIGEVLAVFPDSSLVVKTIDGNLLIAEYECAVPVAARQQLS